METWGNFAALAGAVFGALTFFRETLFLLARASATLSGDVVTVKVFNPGRAPLYVREARLIGATVGIDHYDPEHGTGHVTDSGERAFGVREICPTGGNITFTSYVVPAGQTAFLKASLRPVWSCLVHREYRVIIRFISE